MTVKLHDGEIGVGVGTQVVVDGGGGVVVVDGVGVMVVVDGVGVMVVVVQGEEPVEKVRARASAMSLTVNN